MSEGFFSRWSRRKQALASGATVTQGVPLATPTSQQATDLAPQPQQGSEAGGLVQPTVVQTPLPTLDDVQSLTPASDFQPFVQRGVDAQVRNAAMKKLFADPHFNVMDGLDIYIDDYSRPDPLPAGMLRRMATAQFLKLVPDDVPQTHIGLSQDHEGRVDAAHASQVVAQSPLPASTAQAPEHDHPDLQLQPDSAAPDPQPGSGAR